MLLASCVCLSEFLTEHLLFLCYNFSILLQENKCDTGESCHSHIVSSSAASEHCSSIAAVSLNHMQMAGFLELYQLL